MKSWDTYYEVNKDALAENHRLNIYLHDNAAVIEELTALDYTESTFDNENHLFESYLPIGEYCFTSTFEGEDEDEREVDVIEIQHAPALRTLELSAVGLVFMKEASDKETAEWVAEWLGFKIESVHSICMFEGSDFVKDQKLLKQQQKD